MKQGKTAPVQRDDESDADFFRRVEQWVREDTVRSRGDNREWTGSPLFHLDRSKNEGETK